MMCGRVGSCWCDGGGGGDTTDECILGGQAVNLFDGHFGRRGFLAIGQKEHRDVACALWRAHLDLLPFPSWVRTAVRPFGDNSATGWAKYMGFHVSGHVVAGYVTGTQVTLQLTATLQT